jgi:aspartyl-tRNA(Asn)/glutamyl-tRNA(Gln) amidotransferase subunit C
MNIDDQLLDKLAKLAKLKIPEDQKESMKNQLSEIITWMDKLREVNTEGIEPLTNMSEEVNASRQDKIQHEGNRDALLANAPDHDDKFVKVPIVKKS